GDDKIRIVAWAGLYFFLHFAASGFGQPASRDEERLREVFGAVKNRQADLNPIWITYKVYEFQSTAYLKAMDKQFLLPGLPPTQYFKDAAVEFTADFARKGAKLRSTGRVPIILPTGEIGPSACRVTVFNGKRTIRFDQLNHYSISF